jgi:rhodanese-related sulfurtransferase
MKKMIELTPKQASEKIQQNNQVLFLDVRSCVEYKFVGHAVGSILVPWMDEPEWEVNPRFCHAVSALLVDRHDPLNTEIILICRSGKRSPRKNAHPKIKLGYFVVFFHSLVLASIQSFFSLYSPIYLTTRLLLVAKSKI